jgi:hypothetical protein
MLPNRMRAALYSLQVPQVRGSLPNYCLLTLSSKARSRCPLIGWHPRRLHYEGMTYRGICQNLTTRTFCGSGTERNQDPRCRHGYCVVLARCARMILEAGTGMTGLLLNMFLVPVANNCILLLACTPVTVLETWHPPPSPRESPGSLPSGELECKRFLG